MPSKPVRVLLRGGSVVSPTSPLVTAMLTVDGQIAWLGDDAAAANHVDSADTVVELDGRLVTPGFVDAHAHLGSTGFALQSLDLAGTPSVSAALDALSRFAQNHHGRVVFAFGWDETRWPEGRSITIGELDQAVGDKVAYVARVDSHSSVVSSALLDLDSSISGRDGWRGDGLVARDAHHAARAVTHTLWTAADREAALRAALAHAASRGITSLHELNAPHIAPFSDFATLRTIAAEEAVPEIVSYWGAFLGGAEHGQISEELRGYAGDLCVDGAVGSRTACMHRPYADAETSGSLYLDRVHIAEHVVFCTERDLQAGFHVIGDRALEETIAGLEAAAEKLGDDAIVRTRHRLEHVEMPTPQALAAMARLGVVASVQPAFDAAWGAAGGLYEQRLGTARALPMNPFGSMHRAGVVLAFGSDSPITPLNPWGGVRAAAFHHQEDERLTVRAAFDAHTRGGHRAGRDDQRGLLTPGSRATYAVWDIDADVAATSPHERSSALPDVHPDGPLPACVQTVVAGTPVFTAESALDVRANR